MNNMDHMDMDMIYDIVKKISMMEIWMNYMDIFMIWIIWKSMINDGNMIVTIWISLFSKSNDIGQMKCN